MKKKTLNGLIILGIVGACMIPAVHLVTKMAKVPAGYKAKVTCSEVFVAGRNIDDVMTTNFANISPTFDWVNLQVDESRKTVKGSLFGFGSSKAVYRKNIGCSLEEKDGLAPVTIPVNRSDKRHEYEVKIDDNVQNSIQTLFNDDILSNPIATRGLVVVQDNVIIAEHYAEGFDEKTRQQSWSTAKGFIQALVGIAVKKGYLKIDENALMPNWQGDDPRAEITIGHLLHMASGLEFSEAYANPNSHVDQMLFNQKDMGNYAASLKLLHKPGTVSRYSSGTTNIISNILRDRLEASGKDYHAFPKQELFNKLSMDSVVFEVDAAGNFIGSSYIYATPREFARFGQLYLQNGKWQDEQILPEDWVEYTRQPAPGTNGKYGSHWSLNLDQMVIPGLPSDVIHLGGNDGQMIVVIPSKNTVIVRMGVTRYPATLEDDLYPLFHEVFNSIK